MEILYKQPESKIIVFVNTIEEIKQLQKMKELHGIAPVFFSNLTQERREILLYLFRKGAIRCMISTDVASRGLDIVNVDYVIHYDISRNQRSFIHRSGRCGRNQCLGVNISFVTRNDMRMIKEIE